jgi:sugar/nucleoside kinase (ribokinase family)
MTCLQPISSDGLKYHHVVGTGGIGHGMFLLLEGDHTLGRNESRMASILPYKDFCKQHIILHYITILLDTKVEGSFQSFPIGKVGNDDIGKSLIEKMNTVGMNTKYIGISDDYGTLFSICFQYPEHTGCNIKTSKSASSCVSPEDISRFFQNFGFSGNQEIIVAAPEVPLISRIKLLEYGRRRGSITVASILSAEVDEFKRMHGFELVDILSINIDEAENIAKINGVSIAGETIVDACINTLLSIQPEISILITDGSNGSYCFDNNTLEYTPALAVPVASTAGAGDAFLAGTLVGLSCGLPLKGGKTDKWFAASPLKSAVELGVLLAALSVTTKDTIHPSANAKVLYEFAKTNNISFSDEFSQIFKEIIL